MAKYYEASKFNTILFQMHKHELKKLDICRALNIAQNTLDIYIREPYRLTLKEIVILAGLFGMQPEKFTYILLRNKPQLKNANSWQVENMVNDAEEKYGK